MLIQCSECDGIASFMANVLVHGKTHMGSQQQWMTRNADLRAANAVGGGELSQSVQHYGSLLCAAWNFVFVGTLGAPENSTGLSELYQGAAFTNSTSLFELVCVLTGSVLGSP